MTKKKDKKVVVPLIKYRDPGQYVVFGHDLNGKPYVMLITFPSVQERVRERLRKVQSGDGETEGLEEKFTIHEESQTRIVDVLSWFKKSVRDSSIVDPEVVPLETFKPIAPALSALVTSNTEV